MSANSPRAHELVNGLRLSTSAESGSEWSLGQRSRVRASQGKYLSIGLDMS
jgi:hypothetical protein